MADSNHIETVQDVLRDMRQWTDCIGFVERIEAALSIRALSPAGGDWVIAPRKVTRAMLEAYWLHGYDGSEEEELKAMLTDGDLAVLQAEWNAMLAASPQQEPGAVGGVFDDVIRDALKDGRGVMRIDPAAMFATADESGTVREVVMNNEGCGTTAILPSGQTLAGAGGALMKCVCGDPKDGGGCTNKCDRGQIPPIPAETYRVTDGKLQKATATSASTTGDAEKWIPDEMDVDNTMLHVRYGIDYMMGWNECRDSFLLAARRAREVG